MEIRVEDDTLGSVFLEIEFDEHTIRLELTEEEAGNLMKDIEVLLEDRWHERFPL